MAVRVSELNPIVLMYNIESCCINTIAYFIAHHCILLTPLLCINIIAFY